MMTHLLKSRCISVLIVVSLLLVTVMLSSCASNRLVSTWTDPALADKKIEDVLVIGVFRDATIRRLFENSFARGLQQENVKSYTGHTVEAVKESVIYDTVVKAVETTGAKTVLITRYVDVTRETSSTHDSVGRLSRDLVDVPIAQMLSYSPPSTSTNTRYTVALDTLLYDVPTRKLIWSARSELINPVMTNTYLDAATSLFIADLKNRNLL